MLESMKNNISEESDKSCLYYQDFKNPPGYSSSMGVYKKPSTLEEEMKLWDNYDCKNRTSSGAFKTSPYYPLIYTLSDLSEKDGVSKNMSVMYSGKSEDKVFVISDSRQITKEVGGVKPFINDNCRKIIYVDECKSIFGLTGISAVGDVQFIDEIERIAIQLTPQNAESAAVLFHKHFINKYDRDSGIMNIHHCYFKDGLPHIQTYDIEFDTKRLIVSNPFYIYIHSGLDTARTDIRNLVKQKTSAENPDFAVVKSAFDDYIKDKTRTFGYSVGGRTKYIILHKDGRVETNV